MLTRARTPEAEGGEGGKKIRGRKRRERKKSSRRAWFFLIHCEDFDYKSASKTQFPPRSGTTGCTQQCIRDRLAKNLRSGLKVRVRALSVRSRFKARASSNTYTSRINLMYTYTAVYVYDFLAACSTYSRSYYFFFFALPVIEPNFRRALARFTFFDSREKDIKKEKFSHLHSANNNIWKRAVSEHGVAQPSRQVNCN